MRSSHTDGTIFCNQHMNGIWMPVLFSHPEHRDYTPLLTETVISSFAVCAIEKGLLTLNSIPKQRKTVAAAIKSSYSMLCYDLTLIWPILLLYLQCNSKRMFIVSWLSLFPWTVWDIASCQTWIQLHFSVKTPSAWARDYKRTWDTRAHHDHKVWLFIYTYWWQPTCLPLCSDAELILRDWKYWFDSVSYFVVEKGGSAPSWLLAPYSHIGLATQPVPRETHNYSRPFRLVQQPVQLWLHSLVIYFIPFPLLRGTPQHNDQASHYNNVCDDKHSGS